MNKMSRRHCAKLFMAGGLAVGLPPILTNYAFAQAGEGMPGLTGTLIVLEKRSHALSFYDLATGRREDSIALQNYPHEFTVDSKNTFAYIGHYGVEASTDTGPGGSSIFVIDLTKRAQIRSIDCRPFTRIHGIGMDGKDRLYALSEEKATLLEFETPQTAQYPDRASNTGGIKSHLFSITRDGSRAFVSNILSNTVSQLRPFEPEAPPVVVATGLWPEGICLSTDEATLYVANRKSSTLTVLDAHTMKTMQSMPTRGEAVRIYPLSEGRIILANMSDKSVSVIDHTLQETANIHLDAKPIAVSLHPEQPIAFASLDTNKIAAIDLKQQQVIGSIVTGQEPDVTYFLAR